MCACTFVATGTRFIMDELNITAPHLLTGYYGYFCSLGADEEWSRVISVLSLETTVILLCTTEVCVYMYKINILYSFCFSWI